MLNFIFLDTSAMNFSPTVLTRYCVITVNVTYVCARTYEQLIGSQHV